MGLAVGQLQQPLSLPRTCRSAVCPVHARGWARAPCCIGAGCAGGFTSVVPCWRWREQHREEGGWWLRSPCLAKHLRRQRRVTKSPCRSHPGLPLHDINPAVDNSGSSGGHPARELFYLAQGRAAVPDSLQTALDVVPGAGSLWRSAMPTP